MNEGACATLIIACTVALGFAFTLMLSSDETNGKVRSDVTIGVIYCLLCSAYIVCMTAPYDDEEDEY